MEGHDRAALWRDDRWRSARLPATVTGLVLVERVLLDEVGSPAPLLRDLGDIGRSWADPVASVLAVVALMAETLVAYLLIVLLLQSLCSLPRVHGPARRPAHVTGQPGGGPAPARSAPRGALLAQVTLATAPGAPPGHRWDGSELVSTASLAVGGSVGPSTLSGLATTSHAGDGVAGHSRRWDRPERGPLPAGQRRRCRPGWGAGRPTRRPVTATRLAGPWRPRTAATQAPRQRLGIARRRATQRLQYGYRFGVVPEG